MINYYFSQFIKKTDWTGPNRARPMGVRPPGANGGTGSVFSNLDRLGPAHVDRVGPWTVNRARPWTVRVWTEPDRFQITRSNLILI
jgi:hypothetical protein